MVILAALLVFGLVYAIKLIGSAPEVGGPGGAAPDGLPPAAVYVQTIVQETAQDEAQVTGSLKAAAKTERGQHSLTYVCRLFQGSEGL